MGVLRTSPSGLGAIREGRGEVKVKVVQEAIAWWRLGLGALAVCTLNSLG